LKSYGCLKTFLALHSRQSIRRLNSFLKGEIKPLFQQFFGLALQAISPFFQFFYQMKNLIVVSTIFFLLRMQAISLLFQFFSLMETLTVVSTFFFAIAL